MLRSVNAHVPGEFKVRQTSSDYCQIVYKPYVVNELGFGEGCIISDFVDTHDRGQNVLWINEKAVITFINRNLYSIALMLYFYLGHLMIQDAAFGLSHNISFKQILESCAEFPEDWPLKHPTTLMCALADLQDAGLIKWNASVRTFEIFHITLDDPNQRV